MISIILPTFNNNLDFLKFTINSIEKNSKYPFELLLWDNGNSGETQQYIQKCKYFYLRSETNIGIAKPYNQLAKKAKYNIIFFADDDMYFLPGWDSFVEDFNKPFVWRTSLILDASHDNMSLFCNYGRKIAGFDGQQLKKEIKGYVHPFIRKGSFMPSALTKEDYFKIGGYDEQFFLGEADFIWRTFNYFKINKGTQQVSPSSFIYHFKGQSGRREEHQQDRLYLRKQMNKKYGESIYEKMDEIIGFFDILGPTFDKNNNKIKYDW